MKKSQLTLKVLIVISIMYNSLGLLAQSVKTEHEIRFQNWMNTQHSISLMPSTATTGQFKLVLPPLMPSATELLAVGEVSGNVATLVWRECSFIGKEGFIGESNSFIGTTNSAPLKLFTDNTERLRITESGKYLFNTSVIDDTVTVSISGDVSIDGDLIVSGSIVSNSTASASSPMPCGVIMQYAGTTPPDGWLICDGSAVSRTDYSTLFSVIGISFGAGDGVNTFNLPDFGGRVPIGTSVNYSLADSGGAEEHTLTIDEMPEHRHIIRGTTRPGDRFDVSNAVFAPSLGGQEFRRQDPDLSMRPTAMNFEGGGLPHNNMQPYLVVNYIIKY